jgi:hypothetical protein
MDATTALDQLDTAINKRITQENNFIDRMVLEFKKIAKDMQHTAQADPAVEDAIRPYIDRINAAANKLNVIEPLGTDDQFTGAVNRVINDLEDPEPGTGRPGYMPPPEPVGGWKSRRTKKRKTKRRKTFRR